MELKVKGSAKAAKELKVKREKQDSVEVLHCHLVLDEIFVDRRTIDQLCGQARGWAAAALFDDLGAPRMRLTLRLKDLQLDLAGKVYREAKVEQGNLLNLKGAKATKMELELIPNGALLKIRSTWNTRGDEAEDCGGLLGRDVEVDLMLTAAAQQDLAKPDSPAVRKPSGKGSRQAGRVPIGDLAGRVDPESGNLTIVDRETGEVLSRPDA